MRIVTFHSHQNGYEWIQHHKKGLWTEIEGAIAHVDANRCRTKASKEARKAGRLLLSPIDMNKELNDYLKPLGWKSRTTRNFLSEDPAIIRELVKLKPKEQKELLKKKKKEILGTMNQTDFVKEGVAVEVQFGKYAFVAHDLFVKHMSFYLNDDINVGVEIVPMKSMEREMSSGVPYYERDLFNLMRQGRGIPQVPLVLIGVAP